MCARFGGDGCLSGRGLVCKGVHLSVGAKCQFSQMSCEGSSLLSSFACECLVSLYPQRVAKGKEGGGREASNIVAPSSENVES